MVFRRTLFSALIVGLLAGFVFSLIQYLSINPIILKAEAFEVYSAHDHASHDHSVASSTSSSAQEWAPAEGVERTGYSVLANVIAGVGYSAILLALMVQFQQQGLARLNFQKGLLWAVAGFITFFVAPGLGMPPEIPGIEAEPVKHRQAWWLMCVCCVGAGLCVLGLAPLKVKLLGSVLLALPYMVTIPHGDGPLFTHPDAQTVTTLIDLHQQFIFVSGLGNLAFWLIIGVVSTWLINVWILKNDVLIEVSNKNREEGGVLGA